jgi:hypothetical protein
MPIEDWISDPIASERHERMIPASPERAVELALELPPAPDPIVRTLLKLRGLDPGESARGVLESDAFVVLQREPREVVAGMGRPVWTPRGGDRGPTLTDPADWETWSEPHSFKAVMTFRGEPVGDGRSRLVTETQVVPTDDWARRAFRRYWLVVGPFSALIRRRWLRAIEKRAEAEPSG